MSKNTAIKTLLIVFTFFWMTNASAQYNVDSLKAIIKNPKVHDTTKLAGIVLLIDDIPNVNDIKPYNDLMGKIARKNLGNQSLDPAVRKKYSAYLAGYYNNLSILLEENRNDRSLVYLDKSIRLYQSVQALNDVYSGIVSKGMLLSRRGKNVEAINCYFEALKFFEKNENENFNELYYVYSNLGVIYGELEKNEESIKFIKKAIYYFDKKGTDVSTAELIQKSVMYFNIGSKYILLKNYPEATKNLKTALDLAKRGDNNSYSAIAVAKLGLIELENNRLEAAERKFIAANSIAENDYSKSYTLAYLGKLNYYKKQYAQAKHYLEDGVKFAKLCNNNGLLEFCYELLYKIHKAEGNDTKALEMLELYNKVYAINKIKSAKNELEKQQLEYDYQKKELNYKLDSQRKSASKNIFLIGLSSIIVLLLIGVYFFYRNSRQKQAIANFEKNELNQKLLLSQMNPHFIFNSIDNIQSLIYNKQEKEAVNYLTKFSKLTRQILENSNERYISLDEELIMMDNYMSIQQLLYNNKFDFQIDVDQTIDTEAILLPPMLTQPFIENSIKHGLKNTANKGFIQISFKFDNEKLTFEISDNGTGFTDSEVVNRKSLAMKITKERLANSSNKSNFEVHAENRSDDKKNIIGAKVFFEIPYIYEN